MKKWELVFIGVTSLLCVFIIIMIPDWGLYSDYSEDMGDTAVRDKGRNERSTPRSFVLPATPAVALLQERKHERIENEVQIKFCMLALYDLGYTIMDFEDVFDIQIQVALIEYQIEERLVITGEFDSETKDRLECN